MSRIAYLPWCQAIADILGTFAWPTADLEQMFAQHYAPVEAAAAIAVAQFERSIDR